MALRDQLNDALNATPADNTRRLATLREVLAAVDAREGANDSEIQAIITRIISEREPRAATFGAAGQSELAKAERDEIGFLRTFLRAPVSAPAPKAAKTVAAAPDTKSAPLVSRTQMIIAAVAVVVLLAGGLFYYFVMAPGSSDDMLLASGNQPSISLHKDDRTMGNPKAPITMLEYAAPACPHCAHFFEGPCSRRSRRTTSTPAKSSTYSAFSRSTQRMARQRPSRAVCLRITISNSLTFCSGIRK